MRNKGIFKIYKFWTIYVSGDIRKREGNRDSISFTGLPYERLIEAKSHLLLIMP